MRNNKGKFKCSSRLCRCNSKNSTNNNAHPCFSNWSSKPRTRGRDSKFFRISTKKCILKIKIIQIRQILLKVHIKSSLHKLRFLQVVHLEIRPRSTSSWEIRSKREVIKSEAPLLPIVQIILNQTWKQDSKVPRSTVNRTLEKTSVEWTKTQNNCNLVHKITTLRSSTTSITLVETRAATSFLLSASRSPPVAKTKQTNSNWQKPRWCSSKFPRPKSLLVKVERRDCKVSYPSLLRGNSKLNPNWILRDRLGQLAVTCLESPLPTTTP